MVVYHLPKFSGKSGWKVNGTRLFVGCVVGFALKGEGDRGEGAGRIWARERLPRSLDFLDRSITKFPGATEHLKRFSCFSGRNIQTEIDTGFRPSRSFFGNLN